MLFKNVKKANNKKECFDYYTVFMPMMFDFGCLFQNHYAIHFTQITVLTVILQKYTYITH